MEEQEKNNDLITRFFDLALSEKELLLFEEKTTNDPEFRKKVATYKEANTLVNKKYPTEGASARTQKWEKLLNAKKIAQQTAEPSKKIPWKWIGSIAAGFVLLFSIWQLSTTFQQPNMDDLLAASWDKKVGLMKYRTSRGTAVDSLKKQIYIAYNAYQNSQYQKAIDMLQRFETTNLNYDDAILLQALSYYKKGAIQKALELLDILSQSTNKKMASTAHWYLGLIHLEQGNTKKAKQFLEVPVRKNQELQLKPIL